MAENNEIHSEEELLNVDEHYLEEALSVLAGSDPEHCSYSRGYVKRQAVFACKTCTPDEPAGICLACANKCHDGHDIFELYTKRNFRCDCGNSKFGDFQCQLIPSKDAENVKNKYNHNFHDRYCTCDRLYSDDQNSNEMIQCVICEDWFHAEHLGSTESETEELHEMVCETCMNKAPFLWTYAAHFAVPPVVSISVASEDEEVDVEDGKEDVSISSENVKPSTSDRDTKQEEEVKKSSACKRKHEEMCGSAEDATATSCKLKDLERQGSHRAREGAVFWPYNWRSNLCTCTNCKRAYVSAQIHFLMDPSDTLLAYESRGLEEPFGQHPLLAWTDSLSHVQQLEVIYGVQEMTAAVSKLLQQCVDENKPVTAEAVRQCFEELTERAKKRRRTNAGNQ